MRKQIGWHGPYSHRANEGWKVREKQYINKIISDPEGCCENLKDDGLDEAWEATLNRRPGKLLWDSDGWARSKGQGDRKFLDFSDRTEWRPVCLVLRERGGGGTL